MMPSPTLVTSAKTISARSTLLLVASSPEGDAMIAIFTVSLAASSLPGGF